MNTHHSLAAVSVAIGSLLFAGAASAEEKDGATSAEATEAFRAPTHAIELRAASGYSQGLGNVGTGKPSLSDVALGGGALELGAGYRLTPNVVLGVYGSGSAYGRSDSTDSSTNVYGATAGVEAGWHFRPTKQIDPWASLGSGWHGYWATNNRGTTALHGIDIAKLQLGMDYRITKDIAISPVLGASLTTFLTESTPATNAFQNVSNPEVSTFVFAGVQGRFDIATRATATTTASR